MDDITKELFEIIKTGNKPNYFIQIGMPIISTLFGAIVWNSQ
jgi:hypothetical protein